MVAPGRKQYRDITLDLFLVAALLLIIVGLIFSLIQTLLPLASLLLALRIYLTSGDRNVRRVTGVLLLFFGASFLSTAAWYVLPNVVDYAFLQSDNYKIASGMFWFVGYVAVAWVLTNLKSSKQWYIERGLDRLITVVGGLVMLAIALYTMLNLPLKDGHTIDLLIVLAYLCASVILCLGTLRLARRKAKRWLEYLLSAGALFFAANVVYAAYLLINLPFVNAHAIDIFILLAYLCTDVVILMMALKLTQMKLPWSLKYLVYAVFGYFVIASVGDLIYATRFLFHLKYLFSLTVAGAQLTLLTQDATDIIYNLALLVVSSMLFLYAPFSFLTPVRDDIRKRLSDTQLFVDDLIAKSPDATCICDREGRLLLVNDRFLDIYGLRRDAITGGRFNIFGHVGSRAFRQDVFAELDRVRKGETVILPKVKMPGIPGGRRDDFYIYLKMFPTYASDGQIANYVLIIEDITERTLAEEALKASERRNAALLDAIPDLMFVLSPEGEYLDFTAHDKDLLAIPPEQIVGKNIRDAGFDAATLASFSDYLKKAVATRQLQQFDYVLAVPSGLRSFEARLVALTDREVLGIVRDITERKRAAEALRESEERLRLCAATARFGTFEWDVARDRHVWSPETYEIYGVTAGTAMTLDHLKSLIYPGDEQDATVAAGLDPKGPGGYTLEYRIRRASDGEVRWVYMKTRVLFEGEGAERRAVRVLGAVQDITERKLAEEALRQSEEKFRALTEMAPVAICILQDGRFKYANSAMETITGYRRDELQAMDFMQLVHAGSRELVRGLYDMWPGGDVGRESRTLITGVRKDGTVCWIDLCWKTIDYEGRPALLLTGVDVTERKLAEEALRESEEKFRNIVRQSSDGILLLDQDGRIVEFNEALSLICGLASAEWVGRTLDEFMFATAPGATKTSAMRGQMESAVREAICSPVNPWMGREFEIKIQRPDGDIRLVQMSTFQIDTARGPMFGSMSRDITDRKRAEEALRESEEKFRTLTDSSQAGILLIQGEKIVYINRALAEIGGYTLEESQSVDFWKFVHPDFTDLVRQRGIAAQREGRIRQPRYEIKAIRKDGSERWLDCSPALVTYNGSPALIITAIDITERKQAEEALRQSEEKFRAMAEEISDWICEVDERLVCIYSSPRVKDILGYEPDEIVGRSAFDFLAPGEADRLMATASPGFGQGKAFDVVELRLRRKDGRTIWIEARGRSVVDSEGRFKCNRATITDITERKQAEEALRQSEEKFRALAETAPVAICILQDGRFKYANPAMETISGYNARELFEISFVDMVHPAARPYIEGQYRGWMSGDDSGEARSVFMGLRKDGKVCWIDLSRKTIDYEGRPALLLTGVDVTERRAAEEALRESEEKFRQLAETSPAVIIIYQGENNVYINPAGELLTGYTLDEFLKLKSWEIVHPDYRGFVREKTAQRQQGAPLSERYDVKVVTKDGRVRWASISTATVMHRNRPAALIIAIDITERKQFEEALQESEEKFRQLAETAPAAIVIYQGDRNVYLNPAGERIIGYAIGEFLKMKPWDIVHPDCRKLILEKVAQRQQGVALSEHYDAKIVTRDGQVRWTSLSTAAITFGNRPAGMVIAIDITESKLAEKALRESEASLARAQTIAHLGSWENDYVHNTSWWSDELYNIAGLDRQVNPPTFATFISMVHPEDRALVEGALKNTLSDGRPYDIDFRIVRPDGTERTLHSEGEVVYDQASRPVKIIGISQDITERVRLEKELFQAYNSLKEMYERKIDFTNAAAHELRTPLTPIIGYTDILKAEVTDERHRKFLAIIERNALRQKAMVNSLLELASLDAGMMQVRRGELGVLPLANEIADNYRAVNGHIRVEVPAGMRINTDPDILRHVLDNLVSNAVKYSDPAREVVIRAREAGDRCEFSVTDHGPGIPREEWGKIFERFYLIGGDRDNRAGGRIGLGLALVKAYVSLLGGEVWLESELGLGSTFYFTVPKAP